MTGVIGRLWKEMVKTLHSWFMISYSYFTVHFQYKCSSTYIFSNICNLLFNMRNKSHKTTLSFRYSSMQLVIWLVSQYIFPYLSSLWDLASCLLLCFLVVSISGFVQSPLPGNHGFDRLFNRPAVDFFVLKQIWIWTYDISHLPKALWSLRESWWKCNIIWRPLPFQRMFCKAWAWDESWRFHPTPHQKSSYFGSGGL